MAHHIFISYARRASDVEARALYECLGGETAFLDTSNLEVGERFPRPLMDALMAARIVVIFAADLYFKRWYCLRELRMTLAPYEAALRRPGSTDEQLLNELSHIILALPHPDLGVGLIDLPPILSSTNWPQVNDVGGIAVLARQRLSRVTKSLRDRLSDPVANRILNSVLEEAAFLRR